MNTLIIIYVVISFLFLVYFSIYSYAKKDEMPQWKSILKNSVLSVFWPITIIVSLLKLILVIIIICRRDYYDEDYYDEEYL
jgi:heme/copper-type cytochrome/quinol oxidase subunit 2